MKLLEHENIPCWYELSWRSSHAWPAIIIRIHAEVLKQLPEFTSTSPIMSHYLAYPSIKTFQGKFDQDWGFNGSLRFKALKDNFVEFAALIPKVKELNDKPCFMCDGSGRDKFHKQICLRCNGRGRSHGYNWDNVLPLSASLCLITQALQFPNQETSSDLLQLMLVEVFTSVDKDQARCAIGGRYSIPLAQWMRSLGRAEIPEMVEAMKMAYTKMMGKERFNLSRFGAGVLYEDGRLVAFCPGDACDIGPHDGRLDPDRGYQFSCHNVDSPMQQITLLAGLAALHDRARKEIQQ